MRTDWKLLSALLLVLSTLAGCDPGDNVPQPQVEPDEARQER